MLKNYCWSRDIVDIANDFYEAYERCCEGKNIRVDEFGTHIYSAPNVPAIVNGAFALELYLKSFISEQQRKLKKLKHNILEIFSAIKPELQDFIRGHVESHLGRWHQSFDEAIKGISNSFEYWRYIHEKEDFGYGLNMSLNILPLFLNAVRAIIKSNQKTD